MDDDLQYLFEEAINQSISLDERYIFGDLTGRIRYKIKLALEYKRMKGTTLAKALHHTLHTPNAVMKDEFDNDPKERYMGIYNPANNERYNNQDLVGSRYRFVTDEEGYNTRNSLVKNMRSKPKTVASIDNNGDVIQYNILSHGGVYSRNYGDKRDPKDTSPNKGVHTFDKFRVQAEELAAEKERINQSNISGAPTKIMSCFYNGSDSAIKNPNRKAVSLAMDNKPIMDYSGRLVHRGRISTNKEYERTSAALSGNRDARILDYESKIKKSI